MTDIYLHFLFAHYGLYGNAPVRVIDGTRGGTVGLSAPVVPATPPPEPLHRASPAVTPLHHVVVAAHSALPAQITPSGHSQCRICPQTRCLDNSNKRRPTMRSSSRYRCFALTLANINEAVFARHLFVRVGAAELESAAVQGVGA